MFSKNFPNNIVLKTSNFQLSGISSAYFIEYYSQNDKKFLSLSPMMF